MKISTKGRYALRLMIDLSIQDNEDYIPLKQIAERQGVSVKYLEQIINTLTKAGFVRGARGSKGGYKLADKPENYTVGMILRLTEGSLAPVACLDANADICPRAETCVSLQAWKRLDDAINSVVDNITVADLIKGHNDKK